MQLPRQIPKIFWLMYKKHLFLQPILFSSRSKQSRNFLTRLKWNYAHLNLGCVLHLPSHLILRVSLNASDVGVREAASASAVRHFRLSFIRAKALGARSLWTAPYSLEHSSAWGAIHKWHHQLFLYSFLKFLPHVITFLLLSILKNSRFLTPPHKIW